MASELKQLIEQWQKEADEYKERLDSPYSDGVYLIVTTRRQQLLDCILDIEKVVLNQSTK